jgi:hypothetical protein
MDVTQSLAKSVDNLTAQLPGIVKALTDAGANDKADALAMLHGEITTALQAEGDIVNKILATATGLRDSLREMLDGASVRVGTPDGSPYGFTLKLAPPKEPSAS